MRNENASESTLRSLGSTLGGAEAEAELLGAAGEGGKGRPSLPGKLAVSRLDNGLTLCLLENRQAPLVTTALWYRAGARDEEPGEGGVAHFLEHMMFKGSPAYGPGEIDRRTQALGGSNNAFTSHDATAYHFQFAADRWQEALRIEADRMTSLDLESEALEGERRVILEEISMYENEPWDALEMDVLAELYSPHPYGRSVLGPRAELMALQEVTLRRFHERFYSPDNAVLVVAGDLPSHAERQVAEAFADLPSGGAKRVELPSVATGRGLRRVEHRRGELARLLLALPACAASSPDYPLLRLLAAVLAGGRSSRLHHELVEVQQICLWVVAEVSETTGPGSLAIALEVTPGHEPKRVEEALLRLLRGLAEEPLTFEEVQRAKRMLLADWVFGHERVHQQALELGSAMSLFDDRHLDRILVGILRAEVDELSACARRYLDPEQDGVLGWSIPS